MNTTNCDRAIAYDDFFGVRNIIFEMTNACNMHCTYCFEENTRHHRTSGAISWQIIQFALDSIILEENELYVVTFFGGEPLLNTDLIFRTITYAKKVAYMRRSFVSFNMVTNATCLDSKTILRLNSEEVYLFISFDGDQDSQDKYRRMANGQSSYGRVLTNLKALIHSRRSMKCKDNMAVRMTVTRDGIERLVERYQFLCQLGCNKITFALVSSSAEKPYAISNDDFGALRTAYRELADVFLQEVREGNIHNRFFLSLVKKIVDGVHCNHFCDCGNRYLAIGIDGTIYPCEGFLGINDFSCGNVLLSTNHPTHYSLSCVDNNPVCKKCWARYLCGGGCYHEAWMRTGDANKKDPVMCESYRIAAETALYIYTELKRQNLLSTFIDLSDELIPDSCIPVLRQTNCIQQGTVLYSVTEEASYYIELDEIGAEIIALCDGKHTISEIAEILFDTYICNKEELYRDICKVIHDLYDHKAVYFLNTI